MTLWVSGLDSAYQAVRSHGNTGLAEFIITGVVQIDDEQSRMALFAYCPVKYPGGFDEESRSSVRW